MDLTEAKAAGLKTFVVGSSDNKYAVLTEFTDDIWSSM